MQWCLVFLLGSLALQPSPPPARAGEPDTEKAAAEKTLLDAGIGVDGPALLDYVRRQTLTPQQEKDLKDAVRRLGDKKFEVRERASTFLTERGRLAVPFLEAALADADPEIVRRAKFALYDIDLMPTANLMTAACLLLADRRPSNAAAVLLAYLPNARDEVIEDAVIRTLVEIGLRDGKPDAAVTKALTDGQPLRRAAAAAVIGRCPAKQERQPAVKLLTDPEARVRFEAASALLRSGDRTAMPPLIALLADAPVSLAWQTEEILCHLAGEQLPPATLGTGKPEERKKCREAWDAWWKANEAKIDLARLKSEEPVRGLTVATEFDGDEGGRVWEFGSDGKVRWQIKDLSGPNDVQLLPGGRVLIAERNGGRVTERDREGKILWQYDLQNNNLPASAQRLPNGNTLIATFTQLLEVSPDKKIVQNHTHPAGFRQALRLRNGNILYIASNGEIVELDSQFKQLRTITPEAHANGASYWASVEPLANGRFLVALGSSRKVVEIDAAGKIVWQCDAPNAVFATRLRNGNTLVSDFEDRVLIEFDRNAKEVQRIQLSGRPFAFKRY